MALFVDKLIVDIGGQREVRLIPYDAEAWERWVLSLRPSNALRARYRSFESELGCGPALQAAGIDRAVRYILMADGALYAYPAPKTSNADSLTVEFRPSLERGRILWSRCEQTSNSERAVFRS